MRARPSLVGLLALASTFLIVSADLLTGDEVMCAPLYLAPIAFAGWFGGTRQARLFAALAAAAALYCQLIDHPRPSPLLQAWNFAVQALVFWTIAQVVPRLRAALDTEKTRGRVDPLTQVLSRFGFFELADHEVARAHRTGRSLAILYLDLDDFKKLNDARGHRAGDDALRLVGSVLRAELRGIDLVGRLGGDEFVMMLPETTPELARLVKNRVRARLLAQLQGHGLPIGVSIGLAFFGGHNYSTEELVHRADQQMYEDKRRPPPDLHKVECLA